MGASLPLLSRASLRCYDRARFLHLENGPLRESSDKVFDGHLEDLVGAESHWLADVLLGLEASSDCM